MKHPSMTWRGWGARIALLALLCSTAHAQIHSHGPVKIDSGQVSGALTGSKNDLSVYKGIPYAAPPVGGLRWRPPAPVEAWDGVREATQFGPIQPQTDQVRGGATAASKIGEDSLYLNIWTPAKSADERLAVMVWIHGGGFFYGSGSTAIYDGSRLAELGVVVVTFNYRLNILSGFAHPLLSKVSEHGVSGNYGLLDQIAALQWVRRNIAAFGGDPKNVTIFGESAGGISVSVLMTSPLGKGLFHKAIVESGSAGRIGTLEAAEKTGEEIVKKAGLENDPDALGKLRAMAWDKLPDAVNFRGGPIVDGWAFPRDPEDVFAAGEQHDVPLIAGYNRHEATFFTRGRGPLPATVDEYEKSVRERYKETANQVLDLYPAKSDDEVYWAEMELRTDSGLGVSAPKQLRGMFKVPSKGYLYYFTRVPPGPNAATMGASHAAELTYVFGTHYGELAGSEPDRELSDAMMRYWTQFAKTGDPNREGMAEWPAFDEGSEGYIEFGIPIRSGKDLKKEKIAVLGPPGSES